MIYLVMYDIKDDACRSKVADFLEGEGVRVQESVFECRLSLEELDPVVDRLIKILGEHEGNIRVYSQCSGCYAGAIGIGDTKKNPANEGYAVF